MNYTEDQLKEDIEQFYGFPKEIIKNPVLCGLWHVRFEVKDIKYYGSVAHAGALPQLQVEGRISAYHDNYGTPVTEEYYNEVLRGKKICLFRVCRQENGETDKEPTGIEFADQKAADDFLSEGDNSQNYIYDFCD